MASEWLHTSGDNLWIKVGVYFISNFEIGLAGGLMKSREGCRDTRPNINHETDERKLRSESIIFMLFYFLFLYKHDVDDGR